MSSFFLTDCVRCRVITTLIDRVENEASTAVKMEIYSACAALLCSGSGNSDDIVSLVGKIVSTDFSGKTTARSSALVALRALATERSGCLTPAASTLCPGLCTVLGSSKADLRSTAAGLVRAMISPASPPAAFSGEVGPLTVALASCVEGTDARVQVDALNAAAAVASIVTDEAQAAALLDVAVGAAANAANKECAAAAVRAASGIVAQHGSSSLVSPKVPAFLTELQKALEKDDVVRSTAIDALSTIAMATDGAI